MFSTVLVANRGEVAVRVCRTLRRLGIRSVAVYSDADAGAPHVAAADVAVRIGPAAAAESYLSIPAVVQAALRSDAEAVHPGYGFLAENAAFARACGQAGPVFVGPPADVIEAMGDKIRAKRTIEAAGVPVVPGVHRPGLTDAELVAAAADVGYPLLVKAAAGGGGKGMRVVRAEADLAEGLAGARREAAGAFGDDALLLERYLERPRHIEIQILADTHGNVAHLGERECSLQRRHQKVIEECPSPLLDPGMRARMGEAAVAAARACGYVGAGTVEFIVADSSFFFLEMNTRLQVEHPVTEEVYHVDLVELQLRVAAGERLPFTQEELTPAGHAVEARIYAEDPARGFLPTGGTILLAQQDAAGARVDTGVTTGTVVGSDYDPMLAKVITHGADRGTALAALGVALADYHLLGVTTNVAFLGALLQHPDVRAGRLDTGLIERELDDLVGERGVSDHALAAAALARIAPQPTGAVVDPFDLPGGWRVGEHAWTIWRLLPPSSDPVLVRVRGTADAAEVAVGEGPAVPARLSRDGARISVAVGGETRSYVWAQSGDIAWLGRGGSTWHVREEEQLAAARTGGAGAGLGPLVAPMPGTVSVVLVAVGDDVTAGQTLLLVEAMKMEHPITAPADGVIAKLHVAPGEQVSMEQPLVEVTPAAEEGM